jgi:uncharacterized protein (DUF2237 family)
MKEQLNVFGEPITECSCEPMTGFFRNGKCHTSYEDRGMHTVCVKVTDEFLNFSKKQGNNLSDPNEAYGFPGLKSGDQWCLCASRWVEAYKHNCAPQVCLEGTHEETLAVIPLELLKKFAYSGQ